MVLRLAGALDVSLRETNQMLLGAGLAPAYPDARVDRVARGALLDLLDGVLDGHLPNPALVLDAEFDVVATNAAVDRLLGALVDPELLDPPVNVVRVTLHPRGLAQHLENLGPWRAHLLRQVRQHAAAAPSTSLDSLLAEAEAFPHPEHNASEGGAFALPMLLRVGGQTLRLFSTRRHLRHPARRRGQRVGDRDVPARRPRHPALVGRIGYLTASCRLTCQVIDWPRDPGDGGAVHRHRPRRSVSDEYRHARP